MTDVRFDLLWPEFLVAGLAFVVFTADLFLPSARKNLLAVVAIVGMAAILAFTLWFLWGVDESLFGGLVQVDAYALFFQALFLGIGGFVVAVSYHYVGKHLTHPGEYYGIILLSVLAMMLLAAAGELLTAYVSLELLSFSLYVLAGYASRDPKSNEASVKYILLGAFSSGLLLYGIVLLYGALGTTVFTEMAQALQGTDGMNGRLLLGLAFLVSGLGFKLAAVPFHMWAPDVYEGAPLPITAYIAVGSKAAAFALVLRLFAEGLLPAADQWRPLIAGLAAVTMVFGNLVALVQRNIKRMLAYSSVGQVGYMLMGIAALSTLASNGLMLHLVGYAVTNLVAFGAIIAFYNASGKDEIPDFAGLAARSPFLAAALTVALFSLAGLPFFAGFTTKFYLFAAVAQGGYLWLAGVAITASLVSLYYYLMVVRQMYIETGDDVSAIRVPRLLVAALGALVLAVVAIGLYPAPLVEAVEAATRALLAGGGLALAAPGP
jgi:NADH-quinone oxidoreductase subunit N